MTGDSSSVRSITVVAAVIRDADGRVLLTRRPAGRHMAGLWEFPGGKVRDGEAPEQALQRELAEELGLAVQIDGPLTFAVHDEPGLRILLLFYGASIGSGRPRAREGQEVAWVATDDLPAYPTPPADDALIRWLARDGQP